MASNSFGIMFRITTWGESHGHALGIVVDGCPAGLALSAEDIQIPLDARRPGASPYTSPREETDTATLLSGVFEGKTTGAPIAILIHTIDAKPSAYTPIQHLLRPGHANFTYLQKYGHCDYRGGGRASGRETACRVAGGAVACKFLAQFGIGVSAFISQIGGIQLPDISSLTLTQIQEAKTHSPIFCPDVAKSDEMMRLLDAIRADGDSIGGIVTLLTTPLPIGLGEPIFEKLEARLAHAMLSLPATKGIEFGAGFGSVEMRGSAHNDLFHKSTTGQISTATNHAGGVLGGISTGMPLLLRVVFKPASSIKKPQATLDIDGNPAVLQLPKGSRHDPCVAIRAVPVVEAMAALVLADALLLDRCARIQ